MIITNRPDFKGIETSVVLHEFVKLQELQTDPILRGLKHAMKRSRSGSNSITNRPDFKGIETST